MGKGLLVRFTGWHWLLDNEDYQAKLIKEALKRANTEEKQQYNRLQQQKAELSQKIATIYGAQEALNQRDQQNISPEKPKIVEYKSMGRQSKESVENIAKKRYQEALRAYGAENAAVLAERLRLMAEFLALKAELDGVGEAEKWLLLSAAIRNQSSLLGFMGNDKK
jgi:hypothetical protein